MPKHTIHAKILGRNFGVAGPGPIYSCRKLSWTYRRDAAGEFSAEFPAGDSLLPLVTLKNSYLSFSVSGQFVFLGLVERMVRSLDRKGKQILVISGRDQLGTLAETSPGLLEVKYAYDAPSQIIGAGNVPNQTFIVSADGYSTTLSTYTKTFAGESVLNALIKLSEDIGEHFRAPTDGSLEVVWLRQDTAAAPLRLLAGGGPLLHENDGVAIIEEIESDHNGERNANRIYPYGAGNGNARLTLQYATNTMPSGYTLDTANNFIEYDDGQNLPSTRRAIHRTYNHIGVFDNTYTIGVTTTALTGATTILVETLALPMAMGTLLDLNGLGTDFVELSGDHTPGGNVLNVVATSFDVLDTDTLVYTDPIALEGAARLLAATALADLQRVANPDNMVSYRLTVRGLPDNVVVGMSIPVISNVPGFSINDDLVILEIKRSVDRSGRAPAVVKVVPVDWFDRGDAASLAATIEQLQNYQQQPQPVDYAQVSNTPSIPTDFLDLGDVPSDYTGSGGLVVAVKGTEDGLEFSTAGSVDSVNGQTGAVVLDPDDLDDSATANKFTSAADITKLAGIEAGADVTDAGNIATAISGASTDDTIADADVWGYLTGGVLVKTAWSNIKAVLKTYFDTLYGLLGAANTWTKNQTIASTDTSGYSLQVIRDLDAASTANSVVALIQDNAGDDQRVLFVRQDAPTAEAVRLQLDSSETSFTSQTGILNLANTDTTANNLARLNFLGETGTAASAAMAARFINHASRYADFTFWTRAADGFLERLTVFSAGLIGIGGLASYGASILGIKAGTSSNDAAVGGTLYVNSGSHANGTTVETNLASYAVPANTLSANGMALRVTMAGTYNVASGHSYTVKFYFGGSSWTIASGSPLGGGSGGWSADFLIIRSGATTQKLKVPTAAAYATASETLSGAVTIKCTGQAGASSEITQEFLTIEWLDQNT